MNDTLLPDKGTPPSDQARRNPAAPAILAGFEWEFLVAHHNQDWQGIDYHPDDPRWLSRPDVQVEKNDNKTKKPTFVQMIRSSSCSKVLSQVDDVLREHAGLVVYSNPDRRERAIELANQEILQALFVNGIEPTRNVDPEYMVYSTSPDTSVHVGDKDLAEWMDMRYQWRGCEVKSRVFTEGELGMTTGSSCKETVGDNGRAESSICLGEVTRLCTALRANLRLQINHTCALQVTLSHQQDGGFDLLSLKKIFTLAWILESMLFALCAPHRRDGSNVYSRPVREHSELAQTELNETPQSILLTDQGPRGMVEGGERGYISYWERQFLSHVGAPIAEFLIQQATAHATTFSPGGFHNNNNNNENKATTAMENLATSMEKLTHHLRQIWLAPSAACLASMMQQHSYRHCTGGLGESSHNHRIAIAAKFLGSTSSPAVTGIEFRMHEGTLDPVLSTMWMGVCCALVKKATTHEIRDYAYMIRGFVEKMAGIESVGDVYSGTHGYTPSEMLTDLGMCEDEIWLWEKKIASFRRHPEKKGFGTSAHSRTTKHLAHTAMAANQDGDIASQRLSCADLPVDLACPVDWTYRDWAFLPRISLDLDDYGLALEQAGHGVRLTPDHCVKLVGDGSDQTDDLDPDDEASAGFDVDISNLSDGIVSEKERDLDMGAETPMTLEESEEAEELDELDELEREKDEVLPFF